MHSLGECDFLKGPRDVKIVTCLISLPTQSLDLPHLSHIAWLHFLHSTYDFLNLSSVLDNGSSYIPKATRKTGPESRNCVVSYLPLYSHSAEQGLTGVPKVFVATLFDHCLELVRETMAGKNVP